MLPKRKLKIAGNRVIAPIIVAVEHQVISNYDYICTGCGRLSHDLSTAHWPACCPDQHIVYTGSAQGIQAKNQFEHLGAVINGFDKNDQICRVHISYLDKLDALARITDVTMVREAIELHAYWNMKERSGQIVTISRYGIPSWVIHERYLRTGDDSVVA